MTLSYKSIVDDYDFHSNYCPVVERYYTRRYSVNVTYTGDDYCVLMHSNRVCLVSVAPSHKICKSNPVLKSVDFRFGPGVNRLKNKVSGKWKHGAQKLKPFSPLLVAKTEEDEEFTLFSGISGKLLEVNRQLLEDPQLLLKEPDGKGYLAIILPEIPAAQEYKDNLLTEEEYRKKHLNLSKCANLRIINSILLNI